MLEKIIALDKQVFIYLNSLGSTPFDAFWLLITKQLHWTPYFIAVFYLLQRKIGWKNLGIMVLFLAILLTFTDQITNLFKYSLQRARPCNDLEIKSIIRIVKESSSFSFFSGHAANSMASTTFVFFILRKYYRFTFLLFAFPLVFAYSRIYLGLHFPIDILCGYLFGFSAGFGFYLLYKKYFQKNKNTI